MSIRAVSNDVSSNIGKLVMEIPSSETSSEHVNKNVEDTYHPIVGQIMNTDDPEDKSENVESSSKQI